LTLRGRRTLIERIDANGLGTAAAEAGISVRAASTWLERIRSEGDAELCDRSSRPRQLRAELDQKQRHADMPRHPGVRQCPADG
jgi:transposase